MISSSINRLLNKSTQSTQKFFSSVSHSNSKVIDCLRIARNCEKKSKEVFSSFKRPPKVSVFYDPLHFPSKSYIGIKEKKLTEAGVLFKKIPIDKNLEQIDIEEEVRTEILKTDFMFLQYPFDKKFNYESVLDLIPISKDLDGLTTQNFGLMASNRKTIFPCTTTGILEVLSDLQIDLKSTFVVIMGDSNIVGRPTYLALRNSGATCLNVDENTPNIEKITNLADVLIVAIGCPRFIKQNHVKEGAIVLDVGINRCEKKKIVGDVDFESVIEKVSKITPVPNGIGRLTVASILKNIAILGQSNGLMENKPKN